MDYHSKWFEISLHPDLVHDWADLEGNVEEVQEATSRLAICNLDWDRITSRDIFTVLNSFKPNNGFIRSVKVHDLVFFSAVCVHLSGIDLLASSLHV